MKILTAWLRSYLPVLEVDDAQLAQDLTLRGIAVEGTFELNDPSGDSDGTLFDMDITTNRVDAMNHYGIAREAAAIYNLPLHPLDTTLPTATPATPFPVRIEAPELCGRFTAQVIRDVHIAPSEGPVAHFFQHLGQKLISNAVDISNFVLLGMGHPTHAFDLDKIEGGIVVRRANAGEQIRLLDGSTRTLVPDDLVVADEQKPLALAGVMGGWDSMITAETRNILVEAAWFAPASIRASSRRHLLHTDASHRFERGADFAAAPVANALVTRHILAACGGTLEGPLIDITNPTLAAETAGRPPISLSVGNVQRLLGTTLAPEGITSALIVRFLTALGCTLAPTSPDTFAVTLPSWRLDLSREIDLIEEVARVYGYNGFANTLPTPGVTLAHPTARAEAAIRARLLALGFSESLSSTFASPADSAFFAPATPAVPLENPLSEDAANLRPSLLPGMVAMLAGNLNRDILTACLFETGTRFTGSPAAVAESASLTLGLTGDVAATSLHTPADAPFFVLKGAIESLATHFTSTPLTFTPNAPAFYEPGRAATVSVSKGPGAPGPGSPSSELARRGGDLASETWVSATISIATLGQLSQAEATRRKLRQPIYLAEIDVAALLALPLRQPMAHELSRFQSVDRDFSFIFPDTIRWADIESAIRALNLPELQSITAIEIWRDPKKLPGVFASLTRTTFQSPTRTLTEQDLTHFWTVIIAALQALGGTIRDH